MRYIKLFENFKISNKFKQDIKDIFVELEDNGYELDIDYLEKGNDLQDIMVTIDNNELFNSNITKDYFLMLLDYTKNYYNVLTHKFAIYNRIPSRTLDGTNTFTTDTKYYDEFPYDVDGIESIGIDIIMKDKE
jgi:hypothetical protein